MRCAHSLWTQCIERASERCIGSNDSHNKAQNAFDDDDDDNDESFSLSAFSCPLSSPTKSVFFAHSLCLSSDWYRSTESLVVFFLLLFRILLHCVRFFSTLYLVRFVILQPRALILPCERGFFSSSFSNSNSTWNVIDIYYFSHWFTKKSNYGSDVTASWVRSVDSVAQNFISIEDSHSAFAETCPWHGIFIHTDVITLALSLTLFRLFSCYILKMCVSMFVCHRSFSSHLLVFSPFPVCIFQMQVPLSNDNSIFELQFFYIFFSLCLHPFRFLFFCIMHSAGKFAFYSFNRANSLYWGAIIACWYLDRFNIRIGFVCL